MSEVNSSRRALLARFQPSAHTQVSGFNRPPNALPEVAFLQHCTQCLACISACPVNVLSLEQGYPVLDGECNNCHACVISCQTGALAQSSLKAQVDYRCNPKLASFCQSCVASCPQAAISVTREHSAVVDDACCNGCGICISHCDFFAISMVSDQ